MPEFSIVTSFFNEPISYIERLYKRICETQVDWEWVVTNDFSQDIEIEIKLEQISKSDSRVRKIVQSEKLEIFRNPSIYCRGEFIFHIDGDDFFHPLYLKHTREWFKKLPEVVCIISGGVWVNETGTCIRYNIDDPFMSPCVKDGIQYPINNYLGRIWRSRCKIDFSQIFENMDDFIRYNDRFIVEYLSTQGDILHLPRPYIHYTIRSTSNTHRQRTDEEKYKIEKTNLEFNNWISKQDLGFSRSPYLFCGTPSIEFISRSIQHIPWTKKPISVGIFGFPQTPVLRRLLSEIYPEFKFIYEPEVDLDQIDTFVVDNLDKDLLVPSNKTYYFSTENKTIIEIFFEKILPYRSSRWVLSDNNLWVCIFK